MNFFSSGFGTVRSRLLIGSLILALLPAMLTVWANYRQGSQALETRAIEQMRSLHSTGTSMVQGYFDSVSHNLRVLAAADEIRSAIAQLNTGIEALSANEVEISADASLADYYSGAFIDEYRKRNPEASPDVNRWLGMQDQTARRLQQAYIATNPNPLGEKFKLSSSQSLPGYDEPHQQMQEFISTVMQEYRYYDTFLVDIKSGRVIYTYFKELDFGSSLLAGPWADTGLAKAFVMARDVEDPQAIVMSDFAPYSPSYEDQAAFVATPITQNGERIAVLIVQLPIDQLDNALTFNKKWKEVGLGDSGELYLVGADSRPRSTSRFLAEDPQAFATALQQANVPQAAIDISLRKKSNIGAHVIDTVGTRAALKDAAGNPGKNGAGGYLDYRNVPVLGAYAPIQVLGNDWAMLAEVDRAEILGDVTKLRNTLALFSMVLLVVLLAMGFWFARSLSASISRPIARLEATVKAVNQGDLNARTGLKGADELEQLGQAFDSLLDERVAVLADAERENAQLNRSVIELMTALAQLSQRDLTVKVPVSADITGAISDAINMTTNETATALKQVLAISAQVAQASTRVKARSDQVSKATEASGAQVAQASIELTSAAQALTKISEQTIQASREAELAMTTTQQALTAVRSTVDGISSSRDQIRETEKRVKRLGERSQEISVVVNIINQIAERTSVLALNASMQAVVAGDAGRGFAVVADEVKRLAENARQATQQIATLVSGIQADTQETILAMNNTISQVVDISRIAEQAGARMNDTRISTDGLANTVREIANTTFNQAQLSTILLDRTRQIQSTTLETMTQVGEQAQETSNLLTYSRNLLETVRQFKLPG